MKSKISLLCIGKEYFSFSLRISTVTTDEMSGVDFVVHKASLDGQQPTDKVFSFKTEKLARETFKLIPLVLSLNDLKIDEDIFMGSILLTEKVIQDCADFIHYMKELKVRFCRFTKENLTNSLDLSVKLGLNRGFNASLSLKKNEKGSSETGAQICQDKYMTQLPSGIEDIKKHIKEVDIVPIRVPLYVNATYSSITEMLNILKEYNDHICLVSSWNNTSMYINSSVVHLNLKIVPILNENCLHPLHHASHFDVYDDKSKFEDNHCPSKDSVMLDFSGLINSINSLFVHPPNPWARITGAFIYARKFRLNLQRSVLFFMLSHMIISLTYFLSIILVAPNPIPMVQLSTLLFWKIPLLATSHLFDKTEKSLMNILPKTNHVVDPDFRWWTIILGFCIVIPTGFMISFVLNHISLFCYSVINSSNQSYAFLYYSRNIRNLLVSDPEQYDIIKKYTQYFSNIGTSMFLISLSFCLSNFTRKCSLVNVSLPSLFFYFIVFMTQLVEIVLHAPNAGHLPKRSQRILLYTNVGIIGVCLLMVFCIYEALKTGFRRKLVNKYRTEKMLFDTQVGDNSPNRF
ncbi:hypothetical protein RF11_00688 [Thelohanellus kitauei]|uniref:Uncharacterized protein n=1 Tax=Thelohanellus kitauei TaxID=669202 RepID=A0A0C2NE98_THEKT|nr:hypothetical protein RF11_00688 [Thelohanellus kitauei]